MTYHFININGQLVADQQACIHYKNSAFLLGDSIFETIKVINGKPCLLNLHFQRLFKGLKILRYPFENIFDEDFFREEISKTIAQNKLENGSLRLTVYRHVQAGYKPDNKNLEFIITPNKTTDPFYVYNAKGLKIGLYEAISKSKNLLSEFKLGNALIYVLASIHANQNHLDDCLIFNQNGDVIESTNSNLFLVNDNVITTPPIASGCVAGVMRAHIINIALQNNYQLVEKNISVNNLLEAQEVFLTNAVKGINWVGAFLQKRYFHQTSKKLYEELIKDYFV